MQPVTVTTTVDRPREDVFAYLDELANHEAFTDHFLKDWTILGPDRAASARNGRCSSSRSWSAARPRRPSSAPSAPGAAASPAGPTA